MKKLYRSSENKIYKGILGGIGEYFEIDPTLVRVLYMFFTITSGIVPGVFAYFLSLLIVPKKPQIEII